MSNIMSMVKLKNKTSRNGFDLSRKNAFTAKVGELLPVACIECLPGDSFTLKHQHFTRTRPVNTAAYTRIREYYDWFFVPTTLLWNKFDSVITQMLDNGQHAQSINQNTPLSTGMPYITTQDVLQVMTRLKGKSNAYGYDRSNLSAKLLSYLGYGNYSYATNDSWNDSTGPISQLSLNVFPLLAYQKIYSDWYRNSQWEKAYAPAFNVDYITGTGDPHLPIGSLPIFDNKFDPTETMFDLRYRNWNKDLFMGVLPSAQYGAVASIQVGSDPSSSINVYNTLRSRSPNTSGSGVAIVNPSGGSDINTMDGRTVGLYLDAYNLNVLKNALGSDFSILSLRYAEAEQKWKEITQSTQQDYKSQLEAHWDVHVSDAYSERCKFIDGSVSNLDISEVVNTNITADNEASVAGKGVGVGQGKTNFSTDVHGYLMCIYSAVPLLDYATSGVKRMCTRTDATDFAIPEFDNIGMEPLGLEQLTNSVNLAGYDRSDFLTSLGYVPRYIDYKTSIDEVRGAFAVTNDGLNDWVAPLTDKYFQDYLNEIVNIGLVTNTLTYQYFKVNPNILDPIFDVNADSSVKTDQLWVNCAFDIKAVRKLDRNGLPY